MVRIRFHFRHWTLYESSGRTFLCQIIHWHPETKNWGLSIDTPMPLNRGVGGMGLLLPLFHIGFLEIVAMGEPMGFQRRHYTGQREALLSLQRQRKQEST